jgi:hypothetical protein
MKRMVIAVLLLAVALGSIMTMAFVINVLPAVIPVPMGLAVNKVGVRVVTITAMVSADVPVPLLTVIHVTQREILMFVTLMVVVLAIIMIMEV